MINKLRKKIFWIIQISFTIIILGIISIFTGLSYRNTITSSAMLLDRIGGRNEFKEEGRNGRQTNAEENRTEINPAFLSIDGLYLFEINNNTIIREPDSVDDQVRKYALEINSKNSDEGYIGNYIYKVRTFGNDSKEITLMENEEAISRLKITTILAFTFGFIGIIIIYFIAKKISKIIVKPVEESFEKQKQFVSDASHELKTPLAVIEANADVLQNKVGENKWITYIQDEVQSMNKLVNDLLTLAKVGNTNNEVFQKFDLSKEVQMSVAVFESMIFEKEIKLETNITESIEFNGLKEDIKHIVSIILDNAIKHTSDNGKIIVNVNKEKEYIKIEIQNQGEPIPVEDEDKIFERFYRIDKSRNRSEKRYGLGLSIAKGIVDKYKGSIKAHSENGYTSFIVKLNNK